MTKSRGLSVVLVSSLAVVMGLLTGCAQHGFPDLQREQTAKDELPGDFDAMDLSTFDTSTSRFTATYEGNDYYVIMPEGGQAPCLAITGSPGTPVTVCSSDGFVETTLQDGTVVQFGPEPVPGGRGWVAISANVRVKE